MKELLSQYQSNVHLFKHEANLAPVDCQIEPCPKTTRAILGTPEKPKCGLSKPMGVGETCILEVGHREPCHHTEKPKSENVQPQCNCNWTPHLYDCPIVQKRICDKQYFLDGGLHSYCGRVDGHDGDHGRND